MFLLHALTRGAVAFVMIMCIGTGGLMLRDGIDPDALGQIVANLTEGGEIEQTIEGFKASLQRGVSSLL